MSQVDGAWRLIRGPVADSHFPGPSLGICRPAREGPAKNASGGVEEGCRAGGAGGPEAV